MTHKWTPEDFVLLERLHLEYVPIKEIARQIGTTTLCAARTLSALGISRERDDCTFCHSPINKKALGRKAQYCSTICGNRMLAAYACNARIDGREVTHCEGCGSKLIPPWSARKKWCSRACGQRGWYQSVETNPQKKRRQREILAQAHWRKGVFRKFTETERDWLWTLRVDGSIPDYWMRRFREKLDIATSKKMVIYARSVSFA